MICYHLFSFPMRIGGREASPHSLRLWFCVLCWKISKTKTTRVIEVILSFKWDPFVWFCFHYSSLHSLENHQFRLGLASDDDDSNFSRLMLFCDFKSENSFFEQNLTKLRRKRFRKKKVERAKYINWNCSVFTANFVNLG